MSKTIDSRVVEMQFDNKQFESNVSRTMSTLDKLKKSLNLDGTSKGLENISKASQNVNFSGMSDGVEAIKVKFSALEVIAITALANITNSALNAGKKIVSALTIDPVKTGFDEYETKMNSVQTIMANTASKGTTMNDVTKTLDELNRYADKTIYNFAEMTRNIGTFTAAGIGLEDTASSIQGIANLAATSGSNSQQASTAMYQLSQALSTGVVKLQDWNSVVNAGMGGELFQEALKKTAREHGIAVDAMINKTGSFRESLKEGWLTADVLNTTLNNFTVDGAAKYAKSMMESGKWTQKQADELMKQAQMMEDAATKVKTLTQLWDTLKEAAQSGWAQTWELIVGDFDEAKEVFSELSDFFGGIIDGISKTRNAIIERALNSPFKKLADKILNTTESIEESVEKVKDYSKVVDKIINGDFGAGQSRFEKLTEAGYDWAHAQNLVNEKLGDTTRHATEYKEGQEELVKTQEAVSKTQEKSIGQLAKMTDAQLKNVGYTEEQITALRELEKQAEKVGIPLDKFIKDLDKMDGRTLLIDSFRNLGTALYKVAKSVGDAWREVMFGDSSQEEILNIRAERIYNLIAGLHKLSTYLKVNKETTDNLKRSFKGLFALLDIFTTITGGALTVGLKILSKLLGMAELDILSATAVLGDMIVGFRDWLFENNLVAKSINALIDNLPGAIKMIEKWVDAFLKIPTVEKIINRFRDGLKEFEEVGSNIIEGIKNGLKDGAKSIPELLYNIGKSILDAIKEVLGIHSPSVEMYEVGTNTMEGLMNGISDGASGVMEIIKSVASKITEFFKNVNWGSIVAVGVSAGLLLLVKNMIDVFDRFASPLSGLGHLLFGAGEVLEKSAKSIKKVLKSTSKVLNAFAFSIKAKALKDIAMSIAILAGSIALLSFLDAEKLWNAVKVVGVLAVILGGLVLVIQAASSLSARFGASGIKFTGIGITLISLAASLLLMSKVVSRLGKMNPEEVEQGFSGLTQIIKSLSALLIVYGVFVNSGSSKNINKLGSMLRNMSLAMLIMVGVMKIIGGMSPEEIDRGRSALMGFVGVMTILTLISNLTGRGFEKLGKTLMQMSIAMLIMIGVIKLISNMENGDLAKGGIAILGFVGIIALLSRVTKSAGANFDKLGVTLLAMSASMLLMAGVIKIVSGMKIGDLIKGGVVILGFVGILTLLTKMANSVGSGMPKVALTLIAMSVAIAILAGVAVMLSLIDMKGLTKGIIAVGMLSVMMALMIRATANAQGAKGSILAMSIVIAVMATAITALSFIDPNKLKNATLALSIVMGMFALLVASTSMFKACSGTLLILVGVVAALAFILYTLSSLPMESTIGAASALSMLLLSLTAAIAIISASAPMMPTAYIALGVMTLVVGGLALIIGILAASNPQNVLEIASGLSMLLMSLSASCLVLSVVGAMGPAAIIGVGSLVALIAVLGGLMVGIGALSEHYPSMEEFLDKGIVLLEKIGNGLGSFFGNLVGGFLSGASSSFSEIGKNLSDFMVSIKPFIDGANLITESSVAGVKSLSQMILILTAASIMNGLTSWLTGGNSMTEFANQLIPFGTAMVDFSRIVSGNIDEGAITASANAGKVMATMANEIPNTGGLLGWIVGNNDMGLFGQQLSAFGRSMVDYSKTVSGGIDENAIASSASAGVALIKMANEIPNTGGLVSLFTGDNGMGNFGKQIKKFGEGIAGFSEAVSGMGSVDYGIIAGTKVVELSKKVGSSGLIFTTNMSYFKGQLNTFANAIKEFSETTAGINGAKMTSTVTQFTAMLNSLKKISTDSIKDMTSTFKNAGPKINASINDMLKSMSDTTLKGKPKFNKNGRDLVIEFTKGITAEKNKPKVAFSTIINLVITTINTPSITESFKTAGARCADGFANGISVNSYKAKAQARAMALAAKIAAEKALGIESPSKVFYGIGSFTGQGFINALKDHVPKVQVASSRLGDSAIDGLSKGLSRLSSLLGMDYDPNPTITPVLDLSNVSSGVGSLRNMLSINPSMRALAGVSSINSMMTLNQDIGNSDVVSAINKLNKTIKDSAGDNINVGNVTYDDGSNITSAVKDLVRAAKVERRT